MIIFNKFKDGKSKIVTMSYDDGLVQDRKLIEIFNKYGIKGTFHINSGHLGRPGRISEDEIKELYSGHEVSLHMLYHRMPSTIPCEELNFQVMQDRKNLESACGYIVKGMSYPCGDYSAYTTESIRRLGIVYSRTTNSTHNFRIPEDFMYWNPTCHHNGAMEYSKKFLDLLSNTNNHHLLYIWGHSSEFDKDDNWQMIETLCGLLGGREEIWYATNIEIYNYMKAIHSLEVSADLKIIHNPTAYTLWFTYAGETVKIEPGETFKG